MVRSRQVLHAGRHLRGRKPLVLNLNVGQADPGKPADLQGLPKDAETFSLDLDKTDTEAMTKTITDAGVTLGTLSADDVKAWYQLLFAASAKDCTDRAAKLGITDQENKDPQAAAAKTHRRSLGPPSSTLLSRRVPLV